MQQSQSRSHSGIIDVPQAGLLLGDEVEVRVIVPAGVEKTCTESVAVRGSFREFVPLDPTA
ncbi:hypothetical protein ACW9HK_34270, partial [Nocardia gipuzkoensis]